MYVNLRLQKFIVYNVIIFFFSHIYLKECCLYEAQYVDYDASNLVMSVT